MFLVPNVVCTWKLFFVFVLGFTIIAFYNCGTSIRYQTNNQTAQELFKQVWFRRFANISLFDRAKEMKLSPCPEISPNLEGTIKPKISPVPTIAELENKLSWLHLGGHSYPKTCKPEQKLAIIVPYRNRTDQMHLFLQHMHPFLTSQQLDYRIFFIDQYGNEVFNRGMLMNVGFKEALKLDNFDCFIFHDVDLLPENDHNTYKCFEMPRHMCVALDIFKYKLLYSTIYGGINSFKKEHFEAINGFSNSFWGWGGEDDNLYTRVKNHNFTIERTNETIARYIMIQHKNQEHNPDRFKILKEEAERHDVDGLSDLQYSIIKVKSTPLYYEILVKLKHQENPTVKTGKQ